jgi:hypothetical protein
MRSFGTNLFHYSLMTMLVLSLTDSLKEFLENALIHLTVK